MKRTTLDDCIVEAQRFIKRAKALREFQGKCENEDADRADCIHFNIWFPGMTKHTAAVRRQSLELTHRLSDLRHER